MSEKLTMEIKLIPKGSFTMEYENNDTVQYLKNLICQRPEFRKEDYDSRYIKLVCDGEIMENDQLLKDCEIEPESTVLLIKQKPGKVNPRKRRDLSFLNGKGLFDSLWSLDSLNNDPFGVSSFSRNRIEPTIKPYTPRNQDLFLEAQGPKQRDPLMSSMNSFGSNPMMAAGSGGFGGQYDASKFGPIPGSYGNIESNSSNGLTTTDTTINPNSLSDGDGSSVSELQIPTISPDTNLKMPSSANLTFPSVDGSKFPTIGGSTFQTHGASIFPGGSGSKFPMGSSSLPDTGRFPKTQRRKKKNEIHDSYVQNLVEFGFTVKQSKKALKLAEYDFQTALDMLTAGTIPNKEADLPKPPTIQDRRKTKGSIIKKNVENEPTSDISSESPSEAEEEEEEDNNFGTGQQQLSPDQMRHFVNQLRNDPQQLQQMKQVFQQQNPQIASLIDSNPEQFFQLLEQYGGGAAAGLGSTDAALSRPGFGLGGPSAASGGLTSEVSSLSLGDSSSLSGPAASRPTYRPDRSSEFRPQTSQTEVIARLEAMGFEHEKVVQALRLCYGDESMAANYLINSAT